MIACGRVWYCAIGIWWSIAAAHGQSGTSTIVLPPVTLSSAETLRFSMMSAAAAYPGWSAVTTCQAMVQFYRSDGSTIGQAISLTVDNSGRVFSTDLPYTSTGLQTPVAVVSGDVTLTALGGPSSTLSPPIPPCAVVFTQEIFDSATGATHAILPGESEQNGLAVATIGAISILPCIIATECNLIYAFEPTPSRIIVIPPVGLSSTETLQLDIRSASAGYTGLSAGTCDGSVTFYGQDGSVVTAPTNFTLENAASSFSAHVGSAQLSTALLRPAVSAQISLTALPLPTIPVPSAPAVLPCIAAFSVKIYDTLSGVMHAYAVGQSAADMASPSEHVRKPI